MEVMKVASLDLKVTGFCCVIVFVLYLVLFGSVFFALVLGEVGFPGLRCCFEAGPWLNLGVLELLNPPQWMA
jgi:hypothetical protein